MQKDICNRATYSSYSRESGQPHWCTSLDWLLATSNLGKMNSDSIQKEHSYSEHVLCNHTLEAQKGISLIKDPLWKRVCIDILNILGPVAFKDFWKINLQSVSLKGKKAHLTCPSRTLAKSIEEFHFVIIEALKKYYPSLFTIETQIG